ncbi:unannotated protein [freshwater metagenome]|uniref:Unannotated protein n=1 Tax=freshwater metagenome TaxID=449393 RepID=A0A6J7TTE9_9ZZZZ
MRAVTVAPSPVCTALTRDPSQMIPTTRVLVRKKPPAARNDCFSASGNMPLPPTGRPSVPTCRRAYEIAPSPVPGVSGEIPHTTGPSTIAGPMTASSSKNCRITSAADIRLIRSIEATPRPPLRITVESSDPRVGGLAAASRIRRATGMAVCANCLYPSTEPGCAMASSSSVLSTSCHKGQNFSVVQSPLICGGSTSMYSRPCAERLSSSAMGVVRNVRWSQLQMLTVAPPYSSLAAVPPTSDLASISKVDKPCLARYAAVTSPLCPAPMTMASKSVSARLVMVSIQPLR